jgi:uncharacterized repeat protein (TIGR02543 family)
MTDPLAAPHPRITRRRLAATALVLVLVGLLTSCDPAPGPFVSDDFSSGHVGSPWTVVDPLGDGTVTTTGVNTTDARVELTVPAGTDHQPWSTNDSLRLMQDVQDTDLGLEVKFDSVPTTAFQEQGLLVEQDDGTYLRFDIHHNGSVLKAFAARIVDGTATTIANVTIPSGTSLWARVTRTGDQWTYQTSTNGTTWINRASFTQALDVTGAGVFAGNYGPGPSAPAWTAAVDYVFNTASPLAPEDPTGTRYEIATTVVGGGTVLRSPDLTSYEAGAEVLLGALPDPGWTFAGWSGDASGTASVISVTADADLDVTATFVELPPDTTPPVISGVAATEVTNESAVITWTTDEPASSVVAHGPSSAYELGTVGDGTPMTTHRVTLDDLAPSTTYHYLVSSTDPSGNATTDIDRTFTTAAAPPPAIVSDDFRSGVLGAPWTVHDPLGDGTVSFDGVGTADARMELSVPAGTNHEAWVPNDSLHVMQAIDDRDVEIEAKFDSVPTTAFQEQGLLFRQDDDNYLRFEINHDGSTLKAYTARIVNGVPITVANVAIPTGSSLFAKVERAGDQWTYQTSTNGTTWVTRASFTQALDLTDAGVFAGNYGPGSSAPAWTSSVDYVFDTSAPLVPEDPVGPPVALTTSIIGQGSIEPVPDQQTYNQGQAVELTAVPAPGWAFSGWSGDVVSSANPLDLVLDDDTHVIVTFVEQPDPLPPVITDVAAGDLSPTSAFISWTTDELATSTVEYGLTTAYGSTTGNSTFVLDHGVPLGGLQPDTTYHYRVRSTDTSGNTATDVDRTFTTPALSASGPTIDVWYGGAQAFGQPGLGQRWVNVVGRATDPDGVAAMSYRLNGGPPVPMGIGPDNRRLVKPGDFNVDLLVANLAPGPNLVQIDAVDGGGELSSTTVSLDVDLSSTWPLPYAADFAGATSPTQVGQVVDGRWELDEGRLSTVDTEVGYDRLIAFGDGTWSDYEATFTMRVNSLAAPGPFSGQPAAGFLLRWSGHNRMDSGQPQDGFTPNGIDPTPFGGYGLWRNVGTGGRLELRDHFSTLQGTQASFDLTFGQTYQVRARVETAAGVGATTYRYKVWPDGTGEPAAWNLEHTVAAGPDVPTTGSLVLLAHEADVDFGNLTIVPLTGGGLGAINRALVDAAVE